jgi:hypothetical protein
MECGCLEDVASIDKAIRTNLSPDKILVFDFTTKGSAEI